MQYDFSKLKPFEEARVAVNKAIKGLEFGDRLVFGISEDEYEKMRLTGVNDRNFSLHPAMFYKEFEPDCETCDRVSECERAQMGCLLEDQYRYARINEEDSPPSDEFKFNSDPEKAAKDVVDKARDTYSDDGFKKFRFKFLKEAD